MPDENGDPTDVEMAGQLGWNASEGNGDALLDGGDDVADRPMFDSPESAVTQEPPTQPAPPPPPIPPGDPLRQQLEAQNRQLQEQQVQSGINQNAQQYMNTLVAQGWGEEQANTAAQQYANGEYQAYQARQSQQLAETQAKQTKAYELSTAYGVPRDQLMQYNDPSGMEQAAKMYYETQGRIRELEAQVNSNNRAPTQNYDSNNMATSNSPQAKKLRYATDPNFQLSADEFRELFG